MPIFEYRCLACESQFELIVRSSSEPVCPSCGATSLERMLSMFAVSSEGTTLRHREKLGAADRKKSQAVQQERTFYKHDHHDD